MMLLHRRWRRFSPVYGCQILGGYAAVEPVTSNLMIEVPGSSKMFVYTCWITQCHNPEDIMKKDAVLYTTTVGREVNEYVASHCICVSISALLVLVFIEPHPESWWWSLGIVTGDAVYNRGP